jgi:hypothetical protein
MKQIKSAHNTGLASLIFNWQKWRFIAPQTHFTSWLLGGVVYQSLVLRINPKASGW